MLRNSSANVTADETLDASERATGTLQSGSPRSTDFDSQHFEDIYPDGIENHCWNSSRNDMIFRKLRRLNALDGLVLDIGCGRGLTVEYLRQRGVNCLGVELGRPKLKPGITPYVHTGQSAFDLPLELRQQVRTIMLLDVIEHLEQPSKFLNDCRNAFPNLTGIVVTVPARMELWSNYDERYGHYRRYDRKVLRTHLEQGGFGPFELNYAFHWLYLPFLYLSRIKKKRSDVVQSPNRLWLHSILRVVCNLDERLIPGSLPGTSLIAAANLERK